MLNLWYGNDFPGKYTVYPDGTFKQVFESDWFESDLSKRILRECSNVVEVVATNIFKCDTGALIVPANLSSGAKTLLLLRYMDKPCIYLYCGENCDPFIGDILAEKDEITLVVYRFYIPADEICKKYGVKLLNTGEVFHSESDLVHSLLKHDLI